MAETDVIPERRAPDREPLDHAGTRGPRLEQAGRLGDQIDVREHTLRGIAHGVNAGRVLADPSGRGPGRVENDDIAVRRDRLGGRDQMQGSRGIRRGRGALDLIRRLAVGLRRHEHAYSFAWRATGAGNARIGGLARSAASGSILSGMPVLKSRIGEWELDHLHAWSEREERIRSEPVRLVD